MNKNKGGNRPLIGVMPQSNQGNHQIHISTAYFDSIKKAGGLPILLPFGQDDSDIHQLTLLCDGFVFTGGQDVNPALYEEDLCVCANEILPLRDSFEQKMFSSILSVNKPILAICRGMQIINVCNGGTLFQDIQLQKKQDIPIQHDQKSAPSIAVHIIHLREGNILKEIIGRSDISVNSLHHQGIKFLGTGLTSQATSNDGLIEAFSIDAIDFGIGVQWHPEMLKTKDSDNLFGAFIKACH
ncbi:MAG: gamma-glutamyl-gamma-aminobutyrate hydrolase family protein [Eubacterium aggregans]|uniref:gamma-glutamyl-gamma-aminobutyrate hydrolase family protein n=1 Tax=Eubacterium aggregans TaxID=81409 RepID=UPI0023F1D131|nr:gamma-glutamyl-gamma-aminobutyrate hydrolase family protein [Eubacterium aggregans]MDD4691553.1 gamma-glutamyl-gamma-aminobutyrate hydrolase family protein [Eubacterium aggregans]MEA5074463.1 gamma-glutamyl-gamma-aminobutyrate hydrolase family protein [Eubacterium aggregans]